MKKDILYDTIIKELSPLVESVVSEAITAGAVNVDDEYAELIEDDFIPDYREFGWTLQRLTNGSLRFYKELENISSVEFYDFLENDYNDSVEIDADWCPSDKSVVVHMEKSSSVCNIIDLITGGYLLNPGGFYINPMTDEIPDYVLKHRISICKKDQNGKELALFKDNEQYSEWFNEIEYEAYDDSDDLPWEIDTECICVNMKGGYNFIWIETGATMLQYPIGEFEGGNEVYDGGDAKGWMSHDCIEWEGGISSWIDKVNFDNNPLRVKKKKVEAHSHGSFEIEKIVDKKSYRNYDLALIKNVAGRLQFVHMHNDEIPFSEDFDEVCNEYEIGECEINGDEEECNCVVVRKNGNYNYINLNTGATVIEYWLESMIDDRYCYCCGNECRVCDDYLTYEEANGQTSVIDIDYKTNFFAKHRQIPFMTIKKNEIQETVDWYKEIGKTISYNQAKNICEKRENYLRSVDSFDIDFNDIENSLNKIPYRIKKECFIDFSKWIYNDINENVDDCLPKHTTPILDTLEKMYEKYIVYGNFNQLFSPVRLKHKIYCAVLIPDIEMNVEMIINDMEDFGYFVSKKTTIVDNNKFIWKYVEFEPYEPLNAFNEVQTYNGLFVAHVSQ